jgi:ATP-binding cassette, subfamily B, bacterial PglK
MLNLVRLFHTIFKKFSRAGKVRLVSLVFLQMVLSLFDIVGLLLLGALSALSVSQVDQSDAPGVVKSLLEVLGLSQMSFYQQVLILLCLIATFFLTKTIVSIVILRRIYAVLSEQDVYFGQNQTLLLFKKPYSYLRKYDSQDLLFALSGGVEQTIFGVLGNGIALVTELSFIILLFFSLSFTNLPLTLFSLAYICFAGVIFQKISQKKLHRHSADANTHSIALNILESIGLIRELQLRNDFDFIIDRVNKSRSNLAATRAKLSLWPNLSKYYVEVAFVISLFCFVGFTIFSANPAAAIPSLIVFMVGLSRAIPSLLRIQMALIAIKQSEPGARFSLEMTSGEEILDNTDSDSLKSQSTNFDGSVSLRNISFGFNNNEDGILDCANLEILPGEFVGIIGKSGVGKSTLVDLILGFLIPRQGQVLISGISPQNARFFFPGSIALVPQQIVTLDANLVDNITLQSIDGDYGHFENLLRDAAVDFINEGNRDLLLETVGENGKELSGGQKQRVGLARALYTKPKLLVLDEATSALDFGTEEKVRRHIKNLKGSTTIILIAHKLETLKMANRIILMEDAGFREITFEEIEKNGEHYLS